LIDERFGDASISADWNIPFDATTFGVDVTRVADDEVIVAAGSIGHPPTLTEEAQDVQLASLLLSR